MSSDKPHFVKLNEFDPSRLRVHKPVKHTSNKKKGGDSISWYISEGRYVNDDGDECVLYFELPKSFCFGVNAIYPIGTKQENKTFDKVDGLQICYPITSMDTIDDPSSDEQYCMDVLDGLWNAAVEALKRELEREEELIPPPTMSAGITAEKKKKWDYAIKPIYSHPTPEGNDGKRHEDRTKPQRTYIKLLTRGKGRDLKALTPFYGPGDRKMSAMKFIDKRGFITPVIKWDGIFWGAHGSSSYGGSVRLRVAEANFTPQEEGMTSRRFLGANTDTPVEEVDESEDDNASHFPSPLPPSKSEGFNQSTNDPLAESEEGGASSSNEEEDEASEEPEPPKPKKRMTLAERKKAMRKRQTKK